MSTEYVLGKDLPTEILPFSARKQEATLGHLLMDPNFFKACSARLLPAYFGDLNHAKIWTACLAFQAKHQRIPTATEIAEAPSVMVEDVQTKNRLKAVVAEALNSATLIGKDVVQAELAEWLQACEYQRMVLGSYRLYKQQKLKEAIALVKDKSKEISEIRFGNDLEMSPDDYAQVFDKRQAELQDAVSFGVTAMDHLLNPAAKHGSLLKKDMTVLLGSVNSGKTRCMATIVRQNALRGKSCLYLMHEGNCDDVYSLLYASLISKPEKGIWVTPQIVQEKLYATVEGRRLIERARDVWREHVCFVPIIKAGMTVEDVVTTVRRKQDEWAAAHGGRGFDLVVDDYPALLSTALASKGNLQYRHTMHAIYLQFSQLAGELDVHTLVGYQSNREGAKAMKGRSQHSRKRLLTRDDMEESSGPGQTAANIITINRDDELAQKGAVVYYLDKSRSNQTGWAVMCKSRYDACITHDDALGATWYVGTGSHSAVVENLLEQYPGQQVPAEVILQSVQEQKE